MAASRMKKMVAMAGLSVVSGTMVEAGEMASVKAFPDQIMIRVGSYFVSDTNTKFSVSSTNGLGLGTVIDYQKDLGGDQRDTIPRIDAYYRFNDKHRIDLTAFSMDRAGTRTLTASIDLGDTVFEIDETLNSDIKYTLYNLAYGYSFYHSPEVELSFIAGLHIVDYDLRFTNSTGEKFESAGVAAPLPVIGLRMGYTIAPKWSVQLLVEAFSINYEDTFKGSLFNFDLSTEYRLFKNFAIGAGVASLGLDVDVESDDWRGSVTDNYKGFTAFGTLYF
jgi:hypothetical protein